MAFAEKKWRIFRSRVWLKNLYFLAPSKSYIEERLTPEYGESSKLYRKWKSGKVAATRRSAEKFENIQGSIEVFDLELFPLFSEKNIRRVLSNYLNENCLPDRFEIDWFFSSDFQHAPPQSIEIVAGEAFLTTIINTSDTEQPYLAIPTPTKNDVLGLALRGDLNGFTAILALLREAEIKRKAEEHALCLAHLYRMLPTIAQLNIFHGFTAELRELITHLHHKVTFSEQHVSANWEAIQRNIEQGIIILPWYKQDPRWVKLPEETQACAEIRVP